MLLPIVVAGGALAAFALFLAASEAMVRFLVEPEDHFEQHIAVFYRSTARNVVFGDSIAANGMILDDPTFVNLASPSEGPVQMLIKARHYFATRPPGRVIVEANVNVLGRLPNHSDDYESIFGLAQRPPLRILEPGKRRLMGRYWQVLLLKGEFQSMFRVRPHGGLELTDPARYGDYARLSESERLDQAREELTSNIPRPQRIEPNLQHLRDLLTFLTKHGASVCLLTFPKSPEYRRVATEFQAIGASHAAFARLAAETGARYVNLFAALDDTRHYRNVDHLTVAAGRTFAPTARDACFPPQRDATPQR